MADYKAEFRESDETFSDSYYVLDEPKACSQIHFQYDFPAGYVLDAVVRSWQENPREEVRNDVIRERNVMGQGLKIANNESRRGGVGVCVCVCGEEEAGRGRERERGGGFTCKGTQYMK